MPMIYVKCYDLKNVKQVLRRSMTHFGHLVLLDYKLHDRHLLRINH